MRDRRNTTLSMSSNDSTHSTPTRTSNDVYDEKKFDDFPDSPILPAPATTKENSSRPRTGKAMAAKLVLVVCGLLMLWRYLCGSWMYTVAIPQPTEAQRQSQADMEWIAANALPEEPTALVVADPVGTSKWTISIPHSYSFPLSNHYYKDICSQGDTMRTGLTNDAGFAGGQHWWHRNGYFAKDSTYLDIEEAENLGALPKTKADVSNVCETSMTFVLDDEEASFGKSLLLLWMSYGLAKQEGRAFFIDDSTWAWGKYSSYFRPPPMPNCARPPPHQMVPCPQSAKHVVVSSATATWSFGSAFEKEFRSMHRHGVAAQHRIFQLARTGYEALFELTGEDALYFSSRMAQLQDDAAKHHSSIVSVQIRRGDLHPFEYEYSRDYLPLERYADGARSLLQSIHDKDSNAPELDSAGTSLVLASDDPGIISSTELEQAIAPLNVQRAQQRIQLATKDTLDHTSPRKSQRAPGSAYIKHVDENTGWEGGFFSGLFFSLGGGKDGSRDQAIQMRQFVGRAYVLDLAILGASDGVVCAISSATCRAAAVMMGWHAVRERRWLNVDDGRSWSWNGRR
ncbi:hypothetical protein CKM354_001272400 [Cercospora kikuchii]|uniref:Uncharacterized protein n=1 Tax=Cercospora kikuchii TaxID=84275 RepID=A0A9P3FMJ5_9PEZI|nr:uncharacterized protein CKM354_001272400 [Cercospora kikuchii]GIZ49697.1 hypothetical protein CKM354_001272400 [Cercospora kikuchii]